MFFSRLFKENKRCILCSQRSHPYDVFKAAKDICVCVSCFNRLEKSAPAQPYKGTKNISYIMSPFLYKDALRGAIIKFKFHDHRAYAPLLAQLMKSYVLSYNIWQDFDMIIPVPLHQTRLDKRGYNQSELVAQYVAEYVDLPLNTHSLFRTRATLQQSRLKRAARATNVHNAFEARDDVKGKNIVLFDDICTTGCTLDACAKALKNKGANNVLALTLSIEKSNDLPKLF